MLSGSNVPDFNVHPLKIANFHLCFFFDSNLGGDPGVGIIQVREDDTPPLSF
jgi:hypothetical protein